MKNMKNKKGSQGMSWLLIVMVVSLIAGGFILLDKYFVSGSKLAVGSGGSGSGTTIVTSSTALTLTGYDAQASGTQVSTVSNVGVNNGQLTTGITTASQGDALVILMTNSSNAYHAAFEKQTVPAATTYNHVVPMNKNATVTIAAYNTAKGAMTAGGGATNQSVTTGSAPTMELDLTGSSLASTQDMICILEASDTTSTNKLTLNGFGATFIGTAKPSSYTLAGGSSGVWVYSVPAINDASLRVGSVYAESKSGQDMSGDYWKISCRTKEYFVDSNANAQTVNPYAQKVAEPNVYYGIEDSQGTSKSIGIYTATYYFD